MMTGFGPFGPVGMGGMFSVVKVRDDLPRGVYKDPGWFKHPAGTVAYEWTGSLPAPARAAQPQADAQTLAARKPRGNH